MNLRLFKRREPNANVAAEAQKALGGKPGTVDRLFVLKALVLSPFIIKKALSEPASTVQAQPAKGIAPVQQQDIDAIRERVVRGLEEATAEIDEYYQGMKTGGRAAPFVMWLHTNNLLLKNEIVAAIGRNEFGVWDPSAKTLAYCIGIWLGERYLFYRKPEYKPARYTKFGLFDREKDDPDSVVRSDFINGKPSIAVARDVHKRYLFGRTTAACAIIGVNHGLHETTHMLPNLLVKNSEPPYYGLSEFAAACMQSELGLPIKLEDVRKFMDIGMRNITDYREILRNGGAAEADIRGEYLNVAMAPWIRQFLGKPDLMGFLICRDCAYSPETGERGPPAVMLFQLIDKKVDQGIAKKCLMESLGEGGKAVEKQIGAFLSKMYASKWESTDEFLAAFISAMDGSFGKLKKEKIDGY